MWLFSKLLLKPVKPIMVPAIFFQCVMRSLWNQSLYRLHPLIEKWQKNVKPMEPILVLVVVQKKQKKYNTVYKIKFTFRSNTGNAGSNIEDNHTVLELVRLKIAVVVNCGSFVLYY